jgi:hypothetical protein
LVLAHCLLGLDRPGEAEEILHRAVETAKRYQGGHRSFIADIELEHGDCLIALKRYPEAEMRLNSAFRFKSGAGEDTLETLVKLVELYTAWEKPDEAAAWRERLDALDAAGEPADEPGENR